MTSKLKIFMSWVLLVVLAFGVATDASAQKKKKKKGKSKEEVSQKMPDSRIIQSDRSTVCEVFTVENPDLADISQTFANMNLRRQVKDYGPGEYSAYEYWKKMYETAPGFSVLVYTDGSAIFREMAAVAKEEGDEEKFEEYSKRALELLDEGEKCYPGDECSFKPSKAYIFELLYPNKYEEIFSLYTSCFGDETDPYSLISITRYAQYMGYIGKIPVAEADQWLTKTRTVATAHPDSYDYNYAKETIDAIQKQYEEAWADRKAKEQQSTQTSSSSSQGSGSTDLYNAMVNAFNSGDLATGYAKYKEYLPTITDATRKAQIANYAGGTFYNAKDYVKARTAYQDAINADPNSGDPYYFIGLMYLSSGEQCGPGTGFDSQRVLWPAFEKFKIAQSKTLSSDYASEIASTMATYKQYLPTNAQIAEKGLKLGQTYTVPCWINETVTVTSKESPGF